MVEPKTLKSDYPADTLHDRSIAEMQAYLQAYLETGYFMGSVLVTCREQVLLSQGYGMANLEHSIPNTPQTKFRLGSITKQFTAAAILKLQEQNLLDVHNAISTYLPDYPHGDKITVHQLLNHTAGIPNCTSFEDYGAKERIETTLDDLISWFSDRPLEFTPGYRFSYSNSGYIVLTKIIETVSNQSYPDYLQRYIFTPLGMKDSGYDRHATILPNRASGYMFTGEEYQNAEFIDMSLPCGAGGLYSTVEDLDTWERSLYTNAILNQSSKDAMFTPTIEVFGEENEQMYYGYGWLIDTQHNRDRTSHDGGIDGFHTNLARFPDEQITIIVLSNLETEASSVNKIGRDLAAILFGEAYELPKKREAIKIDPAVYEAYVGQYKFAPSTSLSVYGDKMIFTVTTESQRIFTQFTGQKIVEIFPESSTNFFPKGVDAQLTFVTNNEGKVSQVILHQNARDTILNKIN
jgi:CubicO group peptidase (beta-lactamase class C family)